MRTHTGSGCAKKNNININVYKKYVYQYIEYFDIHHLYIYMFINLYMSIRQCIYISIRWRHPTKSKRRSTLCVCVYTRVVICCSV